MSSLREILVEVGIKLPDLVAGFFGGVVNAFVFARASPIGVVGSVVVGALTANYFGDLFAKGFGLSPGPAAFICGLCGMAICQGTVELAKKWSPIKGGNTDAKS